MARGETIDTAPLLRVFGLLGARERRVLMVLAERLLAGQKQYGLLIRAKKNWKKELFEEQCDSSIYSAAALVDYEDAETDRADWKPGEEIPR